MRNIECEIRSFVTEEQFKKLRAYFRKEAEFLGSDKSVTYYFNSPEDLRIQKNSTHSKVWLKKGKMHDNDREEIEIRCPKEDFEKLKSLFSALGYKVSVKWYRARNSFKWGDIDVALDFTKGYGYITELEKMASEEDKTETLEYLKSKMNKLGLIETPKEDFDKKYEYYKENWRELVDGPDGKAIEDPRQSRDK